MKTMRNAQEIDLYLAKRIKALRLSCNLTQEAVAAKLGISHQQIAKYENGQDRISAARLFRLSQHLNASLADLLPDLKSPTDVPDASLASDNDEIYRIARIIESMPKGHRNALTDLIWTLSKRYDHEAKGH